MTTFSASTNSKTHPPGAPWPIVDAAAHLGISDRFLWRLIDANKVKAIRIGRRVLIADAELQRVANEGTGN